MNDVVFTTKGDWDSTILTVQGEQIQADRLYVHFQQKIDSRGNRGDGEFTSIVNLTDDPSVDSGIFPGTLTIDVPDHRVVIENTDSHFEFAAIKVTYQEMVVTESLTEFLLEIDGPQNIVQAYITLWQGPISPDEPFRTFTIL